MSSSTQHLPLSVTHLRKKYIYPDSVHLHDCLVPISISMVWPGQPGCPKPSTCRTVHSLHFSYQKSGTASKTQAHRGKPAHILVWLHCLHVWVLPRTQDEDDLLATQKLDRPTMIPAYCDVLLSVLSSQSVSGSKSELTAFTYPGGQLFFMGKHKHLAKIAERYYLAIFSYYGQYYHKSICTSRP